MFTKIFNFHFKTKILDDEKDKSYDEIALEYLKSCSAEFFGTFLLVFFGCACLLNEQFKFGAVGPCFCIAMVVGMVIQIFGVISLAQVNPAVTLCLYIFGIISLPLLFLYIISQCLGAIAGIALLKEMNNLIFSNGTQTNALPNNHCCVLQGAGVSLVRLFFWEFMFTSFLVLIVCTIVDERHAHKLESISIKIGLVIFCMAMVGGHLTGAGMNPARVTGPAVVNGDYTNFWIYWVAPLCGSATVSVLYHILYLPRNGQEVLRSLMKMNLEAGRNK